MRRYRDGDIFSGRPGYDFAGVFLGKRGHWKYFYAAAGGNDPERPLGQDLTRQERSALGEATVYWVWFDEPQRDADGDGPCLGGCIHENAMSLIPRISS